MVFVLTSVHVFNCANTAEVTENKNHVGQPNKRRERSHPAPFEAKMSMVVANFRSTLSEPEKGKQNKWMLKKTDDQMVSFEQLQLHSNQNYCTKFCFGVIIGIVINSKSKVESTFQQGTFAGARGNTAERNFMRMYRISDFASSPETNTVTILEGCGSGSELFSNNLTSQDNRTISEIMK